MTPLCATVVRRYKDGGASGGASNIAKGTSPTTADGSNAVESEGTTAPSVESWWSRSSVVGHLNEHTRRIGNDRVSTCTQLQAAILGVDYVEFMQ